MKVLSLFFFVVLTSSPVTFASDTRFTLGTDVMNNSTLKFIPHTGSGRFGSYLSMEIQFAPVAELFKQLLIDQRKQLSNRGEAHITVITPIEYFDVLKKAGVTIEEINAIAEELKIQDSKFKVVCLGRGEAKLNDKTEQTYYVVVKSLDLFKIREKVHKLFIEKGGNPPNFDPKKYYPHITLGFTKRDLHESDGIIKDERSCWKRIEM